MKALSQVILTSKNNRLTRNKAISLKKQIEYFNFVLFLIQYKMLGQINNAFKALQAESLNTTAYNLLRNTLIEVPIFVMAFKGATKYVQSGILQMMSSLTELES